MGRSISVVVLFLAVRHCEPDERASWRSTYEYHRVFAWVRQIDRRVDRRIARRARGSAGGDHVGHGSIRLQAAHGHLKRVDRVEPGLDDDQAVHGDRYMALAIDLATAGD